MQEQHFLICFQVRIFLYLKIYENYLNWTYTPFKTQVQFLDNIKRYINMNIYQTDVRQKIQIIILRFVVTSVFLIYVKCVLFN